MEETIEHNTFVNFSLPLTFEVLSIDYEFIFYANIVCVCVKQTSTNMYLYSLKLVWGLRGIWAKVFVEHIMGNSTFFLTGY
jgi:hypothetical protein